MHRLFSLGSPRSGPVRFRRHLTPPPYFPTRLGPVLTVITWLPRVAPANQLFLSVSLYRRLFRATFGEADFFFFFLLTSSGRFPFSFLSPFFSWNMHGFAGFSCLLERPNYNAIQELFQRNTSLLRFSPNRLYLQTAAFILMPLGLLPNKKDIPRYPRPIARLFPRCSAY